MAKVIKCIKKIEDNNRIERFRNEYYFLSNMYPCKVIYRGIEFASAESAFQSQKNPLHSNLFIGLNGYEAKKLGRKVNLRSDWDKVRVSIMEEVLIAKFDSNPELKEKLISTFPNKLYEGNDWNDTFWGICNGNGYNHLGRLLMNLRAKYLIKD